MSGDQATVRPEESTPLLEFCVTARQQGLGKGSDWAITFKPKQVEFSHGKATSFKVSRHEAMSVMRIDEPALGACRLTVVQHGFPFGKTYKFEIDADSALKIQDWLAENAASNLSKQIQSSGGMFILVGIAHIVLSGVLDPVWGALIIGLGGLNLAVKRPGMFIINGLVLMAVGVLNLAGAAASGGGFWGPLGFFQIAWGLQEIRKYSFCCRALACQAERSTRASVEMA